MAVLVGLNNWVASLPREEPSRLASSASSRSSSSSNLFLRDGAKEIDAGRVAMSVSARAAPALNMQNRNRFVWFYVV